MTMTRASLFLALTVTAVTATGCKKKDDGGAAASGKATEAKGPTKLPRLGLVIEAPGSIRVGDAILGEGHMLQGSGVGAMQIEIADKVQSLDEAKSDADMYSPKNLEAEELPDGWALTFENTGGMGTNYFVTIQRTIDGKSYKCSTTGADKGQAAAVAAACKTLAKG